MIGRIKEVILSQEDNDKTERYFVVFSEYAEISHEDAWPGNRNPVRYSDLSEFGVDDPDALIWHPMHQPTPQRQQASASTQVEDHGVVGPLTIPEARVALAVGLGVPESAIEITVRY
ncbi:hypothetical protein [Methylobacterium brachythecii]|nr:hypothetical protein [Methylobacterium brachythecii]